MRALLIVPCWLGLAACGSSTSPEGARVTGAPVALEAATTYVTAVAGNSPAQGGIVSADLNGDGAPDLVATDSVGNRVAVLTNDGGGRFRPAQYVAAGLQPVALAAGDFNGDGHADIAVANARSDDLHLLFGAGDGSLRAGAVHALGLGPTDLAATDLDRDGDLDLLAYWGDVSVLLNDGVGGFSDVAAVSTNESPGAIAIAMEVADFTGDGRADLAVTDWPAGPVRSRLLLFAGDGTGGFAPLGQTYTVRGATEAMRAGDVDCDGRRDLLVPVAGGELLVLPGLGAEGLGTPVAHETDSGSNAVTFADLNGDGREDVLISYFNGYVGVVDDVCAGDFNLDAKFNTVATSEALITPDIDGDGRPDLAVANWFLPQIAVLRNRSGE